MPALFEPFPIKGITLRNRIVASPMCQYQAKDGLLNDWHQTHYSTLARGGVGLVVVEATAVTPTGRITPGDAGVWSDVHVPGLAAVAASIKAAGAVAGIQIGHAGRKAGCTPPWEGGAPLDRSDSRAWEPIGPSAVPYVSGSSYVPREMTQQEILTIQDAFVAAARRALAAGFEWLELHSAHGFLGQSFFSRLANLREDHYGGSLENRSRFILETLSAVRKVWPDHLPLTMRLGVIEFGDGAEQSFDESIALLRHAKAAGLDMVDVGLSGTTPGEKVPWGPNFMVPYASTVREASGLLVATSWMITNPNEADDFVRKGQLDLVFLARTLLANPHWTFHAARELGIAAPHNVLPTPYAYWLNNWSV